MTRKERPPRHDRRAGAGARARRGLVLVALRDQIVFFYSPTELAEKALPPGTRVRARRARRRRARVQRERDGSVSLRHHRYGETVPCRFRGLLPDLFREGQGIVAEGVLAADGSVRRRHRARQARRELHAAGSRRCAEGAGRLAGRATRRGDGHRPMTAALPVAELGHYALVLALALTLVQSTRAALGLRGRRRAARGRGSASDAPIVRLRAASRSSFAALTARLRHLRLLGARTSGRTATRQSRSSTR